MIQLHSFPFPAMLSVLVTLLLALMPTGTRADDLLSARCQARCLFELETRLKDNSELRRQLKHQTVNLCKEDDKCSSCILPCRESTADNGTCVQAVCGDARSVPECVASCQFLTDTFRNRPGQCPAPAGIPVRLDECSAACNRDGDCPGIEKCCASGCSRVCVKPTKLDARMLPSPEGISVQERKRKRSAVVRWVMKRLSKAHMATNTNVYVIQWRWGVHKDPETMTPWQTIMVKNKMYAILKHLLMPGRFYVFRVAAVNQFGSRGFSLPSAAFKLSKEVRAPSAPRNLSVETMQFDEITAKWVPRLVWSPPVSELPIKGYQLSWWRCSAEFANAYEQRSGQQIQGVASAPWRRATTAVEDEDYATLDESMERNLRTSTEVPSHATHTKLTEGLDSERVYMVELLATVESSEGELRGEPAVLFIRTSSPSLLNDAESVRYDVETPPPKTLTPVTTPSSTPLPVASSTSAVPVDSAMLDVQVHDDGPKRPLFALEIRTPFFEADRLQTTVSWLDSPACSPRRTVFSLQLNPRHCDDTDSRTVTVTQCVAVLEGLQFGCEYGVEVAEAVSGSHVARTVFHTLPCLETPGTSAQKCPPNVPALNGPKCRITDADGITAVCQWPLPRDSAVIGYRTILSTPMASARIGVASTQAPQVRYDQLRPDTDYRFRLQPVTDKGLGVPQDVVFSTRTAHAPPAATADATDVSLPLDKFPILELPLESHAPSAHANVPVITAALAWLTLFRNLV